MMLLNVSNIVSVYKYGDLKIGLMFGSRTSVQFKLVPERYGNGYRGILKDKNNGYQII